MDKVLLKLIFFLLFPIILNGQAPESFKDKLVFESENGWFFMQGDLRFDLVGYGSDNNQNNPPGFFFLMATSILISVHGCR
jgi:hypothetical protein